MPNWVKNKVRAVRKEDTQKLISILVKEVTRDDGKKVTVTNFNGVIPMPEELRNSTAGWGKPEWEEEHKRNKEKYGYESWYDFSIDEWGTKWDNNTVNVTDGVIEFNTAWDIPDGVYKAISKTIPIRIAYADEDIGSNLGLCEFDGGKRREHGYEGGAKHIANSIWGYDYDAQVDDFLEGR